MVLDQVSVILNWGNHKDSSSTRYSHVLISSGDIFWKILWRTW